MGCGACFLFLLVWCLIKHLITPRELGFAALAYWVLMGTGVLLIIRSYRKAIKEDRALKASRGEPDDFDTPEQRLKKIRSTKRFIAFMVLALVYGLWTTRGGPLFPRLVGASFDLLVTASFISMLIRLQKSLK